MPNNEDIQLLVEALDFEEEELGTDEQELAIDELDSLVEEETPTSGLLAVFTVAPLVILAATSVIKPEATIMNIAATVGGGAVTLTSNPSIADGINGQLLILRGSHATDTITLTDATNGMQLAGNVTLALNDTLTLYFDGVVTNDWIEVARSNN